LFLCALVFAFPQPLRPELPAEMPPPGGLDRGVPLEPPELGDRPQGPGELRGQGDQGDPLEGGPGPPQERGVVRGLLRSLWSLRVMMFLLVLLMMTVMMLFVRLL